LKVKPKSIDEFRFEGKRGGMTNCFAQIIKGLLGTLHLNFQLGVRGNGNVRHQKMTAQKSK